MSPAIVPFGHVEHVDNPVLAAIVPVEHGVQAVLLLDAEKVPTAQESHAVFALLLSVNVPGRQSVHVATPAVLHPL